MQGLEVAIDGDRLAVHHLGSGGGEEQAHVGNLVRFDEARNRLRSNHLLLDHRVIERLAPRLFIHGHLHPYGRRHEDRQVGSTRVVNAVPYRLVEL